MELFIRINEVEARRRFKNKLAQRLQSGKATIDQVIIDMSVYYSQHDIEEPPFLVLKMAEAIVNGPYEAKVKLLQKWGILN